MKTLLLSVILFHFSLLGFSQNSPDSTKKLIPVEIACGQCQFHMKGKKGCDIAVRYNKRSYFVDSINIDAFGDAHAADGFCNAIRHAEIQGEVKSQRFIVSYIKLLPPRKKENK